MSTGTATQSSVHALTCQTKCSQVNAENVTNEREREREREEVRNEWMKEGRLLERKINCFSLRRKGQSNKQNVKQICLERRKKNATFWNLTKSPFLLKCFITFKRVCGLKERFIFYEAQLDYCYKWATSFAVSQAVLSYHYVASKQASLPICS